MRFHRFVFVLRKVNEQNRCSGLRNLLCLKLNENMYKSPRDVSSFAKDDKCKIVFM